MQSQLGQGSTFSLYLPLEAQAGPGMQPFGLRASTLTGAALTLTLAPGTLAADAAPAFRPTRRRTTISSCTDARSWSSTTTRATPSS